MTRGAVFWLAIGLAGAPAAPGAQWVRGGRVELKPDEAWTRELFLAADCVDVRGEVHNDLFVVGRALLLDGRFSNDVWAAGYQTVRLGGSFADHVRVAGRWIEVGGEVRNGLSVAGNTVKIDGGARVRGEAGVVAEDFIHEGRTDGRLRVRAARATLGGYFGADVEVSADDLVVKSDTEIAGNLLYSAPQPLVLDPKVRVHGSVIRRAVAAPAPSLSRRAGVYVVLYLSLLGLGLPFVGLFPRAALSAVAQIRRCWWRALFLGSVTALLAPIVVLALLLSGLGTLLGVAILASGILLVLLSQIVVGIGLGNLILRRPAGAAGGLPGPLAIGLMAIHAAALLPLAGMGLILLLVMLGSGALILAAFDRRPPPLPPPRPAARPGPTRPATEE